MITLVYVTDIHLTDSVPASRKDNYIEALFDKLEQVSKIAKAEKATVICGGDFFHVKAPTKNSHRLVARTAELLTKHGVTWASATGNHDLVFNDMESLPGQPLGVLFKSGALHDLVASPLVLKDKGGWEVKVMATPYQLKGSVDQAKAFSKDEGVSQFLVGVMHQYASAKGGTAYQYDDLGGEPVLKYADLAKYEPNLFCFGHWHIDQGVSYEGAKAFINPGALSRGSLHKENMERVPKAVVIRIERPDSYKVEEIPLKVRPADEVFDLEKKERVDNEAKKIEEFAITLKEKGGDTVEVKDFKEKTALMIDEAEVRSLVIELLEEASLELRGEA